MSKIYKTRFGCRTVLRMVKYGNLIYCPGRICLQYSWFSSARAWCPDCGVAYDSKHIQELIKEQGE
jgi:hypothetical protein